MMKKHRLFTSAIVICLLVCLLTACNITASGNGSTNNSNGNTSNGGGNSNNSDDTTPDCTHPSTEWKIDKEATCTTAGSKHKECASCGETLSTESIPQKGHDYSATIIPPTEEQQGYTLHQCSRCNDNYKDNYVDYEYTEAQYKQMFETEILAKIQNDFNEDMPIEQLEIKNIELELINYETGDVYFKCERNNQKRMLIATHSEITDWATYKALYENMPTEGFEFSSECTAQEDDLAEEIVEFALTLPELQEYITTNNLDLSSYTVINVNEFRGFEGGKMGCDIVLKIDDNILNFSFSGSTGACGSQEEYLNKIKTSSRINVSNIQLIEYYEIPVVTE